MLRWHYVEAHWIPEVLRTAKIRYRPLGLPDAPLHQVQNPLPFGVDDGLRPRKCANEFGNAVTGSRGASADKSFAGTVNKGGISWV